MKNLARPLVLHNGSFNYCTVNCAASYDHFSYSTVQQFSGIPTYHPDFKWVQKAYGDGGVVPQVGMLGCTPTITSSRTKRIEGKWHIGL